MKHMIDQSTNSALFSSQTQTKRISIINLVIVTRSQRVASQVERLLSAVRARTFAIRWAFDPLSLQKLLRMGRTDVLLLDATGSEANEFVVLLREMPGTPVPIIALTQDAGTEAVLDEQISNMIQARIDATRVSRSLLSRTIRQVVAASYASMNAAKTTEMEVQGIRVTTSPRTMLDLNKVMINELCGECLDDVRGLAASKQIDFVLTGHSHNYERLTKTYGDQQTHFLVLGGAGGGLEPPESSPQPEMDRVIKEHHYARFQVNPDEIQAAIIGLDDQVLEAITFQKRDRSNQ